MAREPQPREPHRENVPGELDHASGEVDGFEASLIDGAGGEADGTTSDEELERAATSAGGARTSREVGRAGGSGGGPRFVQFLRASWAELQRVQWPDRRQVGQATTVVLGFVVIAGAYLGGADWVAKQIVDFIL